MVETVPDLRMGTIGQPLYLQLSHINSLIRSPLNGTPVEQGKQSILSAMPGV